MNYWLILYLAIPAFLANMSPVIAAKLGILKFLAKPVDGGLTLRGQRVFGTNKTWRGLVSGIIVGGLFGFVMYILDSYEVVSIDGLKKCTFVIYGMLAGFGSLVGDMVESFFKRQFGIKSGRPFIPFDQIDYIIGFTLLTYMVYPWELNQIIFLLIFSAIMHPLSNIVAYFLKIKNTYW